MAVNMKTLPKLTMALLAGISLVGTLSLLPERQAAAADQKPKQTNSQKGAKALKAIQEDVNNKRWHDALTKLQALEGESGLTPYDQHAMYQFFYLTYYNLKDYANTAKYMEKELGDGFLDEQQSGKLVRDLVGVEFNAKNTDKAIEYGQRAIKEGSADEQVNTILSVAYYLKNDYKNALKYSDIVIDGEIKKGDMPKEQELQIAVSSCEKLEDQKCISHQLERMVQYYPKPEYWQQLVFALFQTQEDKANEAETLNIYRLANDVDAIAKPNEYTEMAQLAMEQGSPGEAVRILEKGFSRNIFTDPKDRDRNQRYLDSAKKQAATDQAGLGKQEQEADSSSSGQKDVGVGVGYLSYQQYDKAAELINKGLMKGGVKDEAQARLLLGIAQLKGGKKDDALATFKTVKGDATTQRLAALWSLHAKEGGNGATAAKQSSEKAPVAKRTGKSGKNASVASR
jgi:hypothetical protein